MFSREKSFLYILRNTIAEIKTSRLYIEISDTKPALKIYTIVMIKKIIAEMIKKIFKEL